jgi:hypothetical protein
VHKLLREKGIVARNLHVPVCKSRSNQQLSKKSTEKEQIARGKQERARKGENSNMGWYSIVD